MVAKHMTPAHQHDARKHRLYGSSRLQNGHDRSITSRMPASMRSWRSVYRPRLK